MRKNILQSLSKLHASFLKKRFSFYILFSMLNLFLLIGGLLFFLQQKSHYSQRMQKNVSNLNSCGKLSSGRHSSLLPKDFEESDCLKEKRGGISLEKASSSGSSLKLSQFSDLNLARMKGSFQKMAKNSNFHNKRSSFSHTCSLPSEENTVQVFSQIAPLVTFIHSIKFKINLFSFFDNRPSVHKGEGSGILWRDQYVVTNYHVIEDAHEIYVTLKGSETHLAKILGVEPKKDLAVLKINAKETSKITFAHRMADSSKLLVGQKALAIGNPFGLDYTLTVGVISALGRVIPAVEGGVTIRDVIQTDASINPGNSGGPLLDSCGRLVGINTAIVSRRGASSDIGFAIPSNTVRRVVSQIIKYGRVRQPGIGIIPFRGIMRRYLNLSGLVIQNVVPHSPADKAGIRGLSYGSNRIRIGDIIVQVGNKKVEDYDDFYNAVEGKRLGEIVSFTVLKEGKKHLKQVIKIPLVDVSSY